MATNYNNNAVSTGNIYVFDGVECVKWSSDRFEHKTLTADEFRELSGNDISFLEEWATNRYPILCNGWLIECSAAHINDDGVFSAQFIINNAVCPDLTGTFGIMILTSQDATVSCEIINLVKEEQSEDTGVTLPDPYVVKNANGQVVQWDALISTPLSLEGDAAAQFVSDIIFGQPVAPSLITSGMMAALTLSIAASGFSSKTAWLRPLRVSNAVGGYYYLTPVHSTYDQQGAVQIMYAMANGIDTQAYAYKMICLLINVPITDGEPLVQIAAANGVVTP